VYWREGTCVLWVGDTDSSGPVVAAAQAIWQATHARKECARGNQRTRGGLCWCGFARATLLAAEATWGAYFRERSGNHGRSRSRGCLDRDAALSSQPPGCRIAPALQKSPGSVGAELLADQPR